MCVCVEGRHVNGAKTYVWSSFVKRTQIGRTHIKIWHEIKHRRTKIHEFNRAEKNTVKKDYQRNERYVFEHNFCSYWRKFGWRLKLVCQDRQWLEAKEMLQTKMPHDENAKTATKVVRQKLFLSLSIALLCLPHLAMGHGAERLSHQMNVNRVSHIILFYIGSSGTAFSRF